MSLLGTHISLARASIRRNRARSFLTCIGIAIGVASIVLILSLTGSISRLISTELGDDSTDLLIVRPTATKDTVTSIVESLTSPSLYQTSNLTFADFSLIASLDQVSAAAPVAISTNTVTDEQNTVSSATILGTTPDFATISHLSLSHGTFLTDDNRTNSVVLGRMLSLLIFNTSNPVGRTLTFQGQRFIVAGVLADTSDTINFNNINYNNTLIMDINVLDQLLGTSQIQQINVRATSPAALSHIANDIATILHTNHSGDTNFSTIYGPDLIHPSSDLLSVISSILIIVASVALVLGGIGVMNIMLVGVAERTHEIGIRKSVGASSQHILLQFLTESIILSILGGILGIVLGYLLAFLLSIITPFTPYFSLHILLITLLTSILVGVLSGTYPALRAACEDPIDALRHNR